VKHDRIGLVAAKEPSRAESWLIRKLFLDQEPQAYSVIVLEAAGEQSMKQPRMWDSRLMCQAAADEAKSKSTHEPQQYTGG